MPLLKACSHGWTQKSSHLPQHKLTTHCQETKTNLAWVTIQNILVKEERNLPMIRMLTLDLLHSSELRPRVFFYKEKWTRLKRPEVREVWWGSSQVVAKMIRASSSHSQMIVGGGGLTFNASSDWSRLKFRNLGLGKNPRCDYQVSCSNSSLWPKRSLESLSVALISVNRQRARLLT